MGSFLLELCFLKMRFSRFWCLQRNIVPFSWNYNLWAALLHVSEPSYFFLCFGTIIFETVFLARLGRSQKYSSFFSGTIILEAVFFRFGCPPKNIVPFFPELLFLELLFCTFGTLSKI